MPRERSTFGVRGMVLSLRAALRPLQGGRAKRQAFACRAVFMMLAYTVYIRSWGARQCEGFIMGRDVRSSQGFAILHTCALVRLDVKAVLVRIRRKRRTQGHRKWLLPPLHAIVFVEH